MYIADSFLAAMGSPEVLAAVRAISGKPVTTVEMRSYCYIPGGYLLPHTDGALRVGRQVAFAAYLSLDEQCVGGELELFRTVLGDDVSVERSQHLLSGDLRCAYRLTRIPARDRHRETAGAKVEIRRVAVRCSVRPGATDWPVRGAGRRDNRVRGDRGR